MLRRPSSPESFEKRSRGRSPSEFSIWDCLEAKMGQKIRPWVLEDFLGPKVTTPPPKKKFGGRQKFLRVWVYFWKFYVTGFFEKKILVTFYCCFFRFFFKNCQKGKVNCFAGNGRNHQILLETCFLRSLDTIC